METGVSAPQALNGGAEEQAASGPKLHKARYAPELALLSRCAGCYKQNKGGVESAKEPADGSSSSEDDDDVDQRRGDSLAGEGGAREHRGERRRQTLPQDDAATPVQFQPSTAGGASQETRP